MDRTAPGDSTSKRVYTPAEVFELEKELATLIVELSHLKAQLEARSIRLEAIKKVLSGLTLKGLAFERAPHGGVRESIVEILEHHEQGLPLNDLAALLRRRFAGSMHPRTPSSVLNRLKKDKIVERVGRRWKLATH